MYEYIKLEQIGAAAVITLNRPEALNALMAPMMTELRHALAAAEQNDAVTGIVLTGAGRGFCAGMDMNALDSQTSGRDSGYASSGADLRADPGDKAMGQDYISGFTYLMTIRKPIIAAINGACAGLGMSIALLCDLRFASEKAVFVTSFSHRGLVAEHGQSWILPRVVGPSVALDLLWSSRRVAAAEAREIGLVNRVLPAEDLLKTALDYIEDLAARAAPLSLKAMKFQVYRHLNMSLGDAMKESDQLMAVSTAHSDFKEGVRSFIEKRPPRFDRIRID